MTIDVEDYFQVEAFASTIDRSDWESLPRRVERNTERLLEILAESGVQATFFTLGAVVDRGVRSEHVRYLVPQLLVDAAQIAVFQLADLFKRNKVHATSLEHPLE